MSKYLVIDTNVLVIANGRESDVDRHLECMENSVAFLLEATENSRVLLDDGDLVLSEYRRYCNYSGQPGTGDRFFLWLHQNQANMERVLRVAIEEHPDREFIDFPADPELEDFDRSDRKFVAIALASEVDPLIADAADDDWWKARAALEANGCRLLFLCPELFDSE